MFVRIARFWNEMSTLGKIGSGVFIVALLALGFWTISPLFYSRHIDEAFPVSQSQPVPAAQAGSMQEAAMQPKTAPTAQAQEAMAAMPQATAAPAMAEPAMTAPAMAEPAAQAPTAAPAGPLVLSSGSFTRVDRIHAAEGSATIYKLPDGKRVLRLENFKATNGPDLFVVLSGHPMPRSRGEVHDPAYVQLAALKANEGNQNYELPDDLDLSQVKSVVIYCRAFNVVFSTAELKAV